MRTDDFKPSFVAAFLYHYLENFDISIYTYLAHKLLNDTVEGRSGVSESLFAGAEGAEVFSSAGDNVGAQLHYDATGVISTNGDVEKDFGQGHS